MHKPARDFICALFVFSALFVAMAPSQHQAATIPVLSLFSPAMATAADYRPEPATPSVGKSQYGAQPKSFAGTPLPGGNMPLISTVLALVFSSMIAFNLALLRHLRRVNASSRRSAWKEG